ncbi:MAG: outer membrane lipoprotein carrier protein LolA [Nitrospirae bacterium]|nr:outer membrane lipoprotein carrier protein LolA [Nitrospirota bacterium]
MIRICFQRVLFFVLALMFAAFGSPAFGDECDDAVSRIQKAYEGITDMKGTFVQKNVIKDLNKSDTYTGEFFIKRPLKMKWVYKGKSAQDLTINNDTVLIYKKGDNQAYRSRFSKESYGQTPVVLLTGMGNLRDEFSVTGKGNVLYLKPKKAMAGIVSITVSVSGTGFPIKGFTIHDGRSNVVEIELNNIIVNPGLKDSLFDLNLPKGVNIYEQRS